MDDAANDAVSDWLRYVYVCHSVGGKTKWMCTVSRMTYVVLCIFAVAVGSQLSRLAELTYVPTPVTSRLTWKSLADAKSHFSNSTSQTVPTLLSAIPDNHRQSTHSSKLRDHSHCLRYPMRANRKTDGGVNINCSLRLLKSRYKPVFFLSQSVIKLRVTSLSTDSRHQPRVWRARRPTMSVVCRHLWHTARRKTITGSVARA